MKHCHCLSSKNFAYYVSYFVQGIIATLTDRQKFYMSLIDRLQSMTVNGNLLLISSTVWLRKYVDLNNCLLICKLKLLNCCTQNQTFIIYCNFSEVYWKGFWSMALTSTSRKIFCIIIPSFVLFFLPNRCYNYCKFSVSAVSEHRVNSFLSPLFGFWRREQGVGIHFKKIGSAFKVKESQ